VVTPSRGAVTVGGVDLLREPRRAKAKLGLVPQDLALYEELSAVQNLRYFGALYGLAGEALAERIEWALGVVGLRDRADDQVRRYSGGMKRRLNLAAGLVHRPELLFLDEPTVGVDPQSRNHIFDTVHQLRADGMTVVYTSHYMEEVEALCDRVAIIDGGAIIALGTIADLVARYAGGGLDRRSREDQDDKRGNGALERRSRDQDDKRERGALEVELAGSPEQLDAAERAAAAHGTLNRAGSVLRIVPSAGLGPLLVAIEATGAAIARIESRQANLETAFLALTGRALRDAA
jgi:ABC-2 type transport system ATP-binding protein